MQKPDSASAQSVEDFRVAVAASFVTQGAVLLNLIEALVAGSSPGAPVEVSESAVFAYGHDSLYQAVRRAAAALGEEIDSPDWLLALRTARLDWLAKHPPPSPLRADLGPWKIRILDASNHYRPQVRTVRVGYVHGADGMKPGIGLSVLSERVGEGSWTLPLEIAWMPPETGPTSFGVAQMEAFVAAHGWSPEHVLDVDSQYTVRPFLEPVTAVGVNVLGRVRNNRVFYLPVEGYRGFGRPAQLGTKFKLNEAATHPVADVTDKWELPKGGRVEACCWRDVRQKGWAAQPLTLYQVIEYRADGKPRYKRPLWLMFVAGQSVKAKAAVVEAAVVEAAVVEAAVVEAAVVEAAVVEAAVVEAAVVEAAVVEAAVVEAAVVEAAVVEAAVVEAAVVEAAVVEAAVVEAPTPRQAEAIYDERFSIEHAIRFSKQELGLVSGQFNSVAAEGREQTWVELVATAHWLLWVLRGVVDEEKVSWPAWWRSRKLTPGALHRLAAGLFLGLDWHKPEVKPRGKSPGRTAGAKQTPRLRFKVYRAKA